MKKSLKLISALFAVITSMTIMTSTASATPPKNKQNTQSSQPNSVIKISSLEDLNNLRNLSNQGENFKGKTIILENDIYITKDGKKDGDPVEFKPMFKYSYVEDENVGFKGTFDGNGKTLHFNSTNSNIFGSIGRGGVVKNLNITGKFEGDLGVGICTVCNSGTIENVKMDIIARCTATSAVGICASNQKCGVIKNCSVKGDLSTNDMICAGICLDNCGTIESCNVSGKITNCKEHFGENDGFQLPETGAIASFNVGLVKNCHVEADLRNVYKGKFEGCAGGIVSTNNGLIENSTFKGSVLAGSPGGIVSCNYGIIRSCKADAKIEGPCAAEFVSQNMWGNSDYCQYEPITDQPQGVIDGCEFKGAVSGCVEPNKIAVYDNILNRESANGPVLSPKITNCKINGKDVVRETDNYYKADLNRRDTTDPRYKAKI